MVYENNLMAYSIGKINIWSFLRQLIDDKDATVLQKKKKHLQGGQILSIVKPEPSFQKNWFH